MTTHGNLAGASLGQVKFLWRLPWLSVRSSVPNAKRRSPTASARSTARFARDSTTSGCAPMDCIIVPIAGRPATSRSQIPVAIEIKRIYLHVDPDPRLAAAAGGAARYLGDAAGLENPGLSQLQAATVAACNEAFRQFHAIQQHLDVTLTRFADRIEVALCHEGGNAMSQQAPEGIDSIQFEKRGNCAVIRLTKYLTRSVPRT
jgi:hypothetical protein